MKKCISEYRSLGRNIEVLETRWLSQQIRRFGLGLQLEILSTNRLSCSLHFWRRAYPEEEISLWSLYYNTFDVGSSWTVLENQHLHPHHSTHANTQLYHHLLSCCGVLRSSTGKLPKPNNSHRYGRPVYSYLFSFAGLLPREFNGGPCRSRDADLPQR